MEPGGVAVGMGTSTVIPLDQIDELPWERGRAAAVAAADAALMERLGARLEQFAEALSPQEQAALHGLLRVASGDAPFDALAALPPEAVLEPAEVAEFERLRAEPEAEGPPLRAALVMVMKATRLCNLRCTYCHFWRDGPNQVMRFPVLARATRDALRAPGVRAVEFTWHGGEVTLLPPSFFRKALWLQQQFRQPGQTVGNSVQTNATRITDEWTDFFRRYQISVGVSLDGPPEIHDRRRVDQAGRPTSGRVREGLERLRAAGVPHGVLMVVDEAVIEVGAQRLLDYFLELGVSDVAILNVIPENAPAAGEDAAYLPWTRWVAFLRQLFRLWWPRYADRLVLRELADLAGKVAGRGAETCIFAGDCFGGFLTVEPNGDVAACDKYVDDPAYRFGNLMHTGLAAAATSPALTAVRAADRAAVERARGCPWFAVCQGACPHDRYLREQRLPGWDESCCGLAPLLEEIAARLPEADVRPVYGAPRRPDDHTAQRR